MTSIIALPVDHAEPDDPLARYPEGLSVFPVESSGWDIDYVVTYRNLMVGRGGQYDPDASQKRFWLPGEGRWSQWQHPDELPADLIERKMEEDYGAASEDV